MRTTICANAAAGVRQKASSPAKIDFFTGILNLRGLDLPESGSLFLAINSINPMVGHSLRVVEKTPPPNPLPYRLDAHAAPRG
jgi:hypothetical protein